MYIFELIYELLHKKSTPPKTEESDEDDKNCDHIFVPVDSTKSVLACTKCGIIKKVNPEK